MTILHSFIGIVRQPVIWATRHISSSWFVPPCCVRLGFPPSYWNRV